MSEQLIEKRIQRIAADIMHCNISDVHDISILKKGMTNHSYCFRIRNDKRYILRIPGEGTERLINRSEEASVYHAIKPYNICDAPIYLDPITGYKVTEFIDDLRVCDPNSSHDLRECMSLLRHLHGLNLSVPHEFNLLEKISLYESLYKESGNPGSYNDYDSTKANVLSLQTFVDGTQRIKCLSHIDSVCDNFLFCKSGNGSVEQLQLSDWEYAGMHDPHIDIAMFCIYSSFSKAQCDSLIDLYFESTCDKETRAKIYCYIAMSGLLWSNWCEYKKCFHVTFSVYARTQYQYAKDYFKHAIDLIHTL